MSKLSPLPENIHRIGIALPSYNATGEEMTAVCQYFQRFGIECVGSSLPDRCKNHFPEDDQVSADALNALIRDESIDLILCARGGFGAAYLLDRIDWETLRRRALPLLGYSDVTALHLAMLKHRAGCPVSSWMGIGLTKEGVDDETVKSIVKALQRVQSQGECNQSVNLSSVGNMTEKTVTGPVIPANLSVLCSLSGSSYLPDFDGAILIVEDVDEEPYKVDRMMLNLDLCGVFKRAAAVIGGYFSGELAGPPEEYLMSLKRFAARNPGTPFFNGFPFGHTLPCLGIPAGMTATIDPDGKMHF